MQRTARFLLWGGFAVLVMSVASCGVGCVAGVATLADEPGADNVLAGAAGVSLLLGIVSIIMLFVGAILKALSPKSRERVSDTMSQEDQAEQEKKKPWYKRWWVIAIVVVVGLVVVGSLLPQAEDDPEKPSVSEPSPREPEPTPPLTVSAEGLYQEREANATRYDLKYQGKWMQITGVVEVIDGGEVSLVAGGSFLSNVDLHDLSRQEQARADKGQEFTALCRVGNYILGTINLRDCRTAATP